MTRYDYEELRSAAYANPTTENLQSLADWFSAYNDSAWNGEVYAVDTKDHCFSLRPIQQEVDEDEWETVDWELVIYR